MAGTELGELSEQDLPEAQALSTHVGWNQTQADWRRLLDLNPHQTVAVRVDGELMATATLASYGERLHWIGMVIVHESQRGKGLGKEVLGKALEMGLRYDGSATGLDATDLGQPLYRKAGFEAVCPIDRWAGSLNMTGTTSQATRASSENLAKIAALDLAASGVERRPLLAHLLVEDGVAAWVTTDEENSLTGYAFVRPGRRHWQLGPLIANSSGDMSALLGAVAAHLDGEPVLVDALGYGDTGELLAQAGLEVQRRLLRMSHGARLPTLTGRRVRLATGLEWG